MYTLNNNASMVSVAEIWFRGVPRELSGRNQREKGTGAHEAEKLGQAFLNPGDASFEFVCLLHMDNHLGELLADGANRLLDPQLQAPLSSDGWPYAHGAYLVLHPPDDSSQQATKYTILRYGQRTKEPAATSMRRGEPRRDGGTSDGSAW